MALPSYQEILVLLKKGMTMDAQEKVMELREAALQYQNENLELKKEVQELKDALALRDSLKWQKPYYVTKDSEEEKFCQRCYDADKQAVHLLEIEPGYWRCMECKTDYTDEDYSDPDTSAKGGGRNRTTGY